MGTNADIFEQLKQYKRKYYLNKAIKGGIIWGAAILGLYLLINTIEFRARFNSTGRTILFFGFVLLILVLFYQLVGRYLLVLNRSDKQLSNEEAAKEIGKFFPEVSDKLLNLIQLESLSNQQNDLLIASIKQKGASINHVPFTSAIDYKVNRKYLKWLYPPVFVLVLLLIFIPQFITESSTRIVNFDKEFVPEAPFRFIIDKNPTAFKGEGYNFKISTEGTAVPADVYLNINNRTVKAKKEGNGSFSYRFNNLNEDVAFEVTAESITSGTVRLNVEERPNLELFDIDVNYPKYTGKEAEKIKNSGNLLIPEGTEVTWKLNTKATDIIFMHFLNAIDTLEEAKNGVFSNTKQITASTPYSIQLQNNLSNNKDTLAFKIEVIKDQYPKITLDQYQDTVLYSELVLAGQIDDDYGFSALRVRYKFEGEERFHQQKVSINSELNSQTYYHIFKLDSAKIKAGGELQYYVEVVDNDAVNGRKASKTGTYSFKIPSKEEIAEEIDKGNQKVQQEIDKSIQQAQDLSKKIQEVDERLKTKKEMDWRDEKLMEEILQQKDDLSKKLDDLKQQNQLNNKKQDQFNEKSPEVKQKMEQLQDIMNNVLDDETKKLYEELRELLEQQSDIEEFRDKMDELNKNSSNLEDDLERTLELFKKLQFDMKMEQTLEELEEAIQDQEQLAKDTENEQNPDSKNDLLEKLEEEKKGIDDLKERIDELNELNQDRKNPEALPKDVKGDLEEIQEDQERAQEELGEEQAEEQQQGQEEEGEQEEEQEGSKPSSSQRQKSAQHQQRAAQKMKEVKQSLESMQASAQMEQMQENLEHLQDLVDNLVTLSFSQETLMDEFKEIRQSDPRFVTLSQQQLKLKDDSKIIQDSLLALSERVFQISSFVMKELSEMNRQMDGAVESLKEKRVSQAVGQQQFTMTSINNLALLLDDVVQQMQNQMAQSMNGQGKDQKNKKNSPTMNGLSELQQQLSEQIKELKRSGKSGRELSEELAKLAAQQERIRNALENFETGLDGNKLGDKIDKLIEQMELNEMDLLNKNVSDQTIERQRDILTRMLDAENAMEQRGEDEKRKGETANDYELSVPQSMVEYLKQKEKEIELLRTIPAKLNPYYKKETNKYFKKIKETNQK